MEFNICDQRKNESPTILPCFPAISQGNNSKEIFEIWKNIKIQLPIVADYPNEYTNSFHHGDKDDKYYYYLFLSKATKESITNESRQINGLNYIIYRPILIASFLLSCLTYLSS